MIIYKTTNIITGKFYIGKDEKNNPKYLGSGKYLIRAIKKYGRNNFIKEVLEECKTREELNLAEIKWIEFFEARDLGYNIAFGGTGGKILPSPWNKGLTMETSNSLKIIGEKNKINSKGRRQSEETKNKKNKKLIGLKRSEETKRKLSESLKGREVSSEIRKKISEKLKGRKLPNETITKMRNKKLSLETKEKISEKLKGRKFSQERKSNMSEARKNKYYLYINDTLVITINGKFLDYCKYNKLSFRRIIKFYNREECMNFKSDYYKVYIEKNEKLRKSY